MAQLKGGTTIGGYLAIHFGNLKTSIQAIDGAGSGIDADLLDGYNTDTSTAANTIPVRNASGQLPGDITGNAATADKLKTQRTISLSGDVTGSVNFDGSANVSISSTLANSGVTAGNYTKVTVDAKGRVTAGTTLAAADIPNLDASKVTSGTFDTARIPNLDWSKITSGKPTTLSGYGITDAVNISDIVTTAAANKILKLDSNAKLPASITGDADTVDGKHASDLAPSGYGLGTLAKRLNAGTDLNTVTNNGWYDVSGPTNGVSGLSWHSLLVVSSADSNYVTQLVFPMTDGTTETCFIRQRKSGTWNAWKKVWTENSDGSGSGLDADLLDGKHASDFATSTHNHDGVYAPTHTHSTLTVNTTGTASSVAGGTYNTSSNVTMTIFKPDQDLNTSSTPRFTRLGIGTSADTDSQLKMSEGTFLSGVANGASAVGFKFDTPSYTTTGAKLVSFTNNGSEKVSIDKDGTITTYGGIRFSSDNTLSIGNSTTRAIGVHSRQFLAYNLTQNTSSFLSYRNQLSATSDSANHYYSESGNILFSGNCLYFSEGSTINVDYIYNYDGSTFTNITVNREYDAGAVSVLDTTSHYLYVGESVTWPRLYVQIGTAGAGVTLKVEYSKGSGTWGTLTVTDGTSNLTASGWITWTAPGDWAQDTVNGQTKYWIRISTTTTPTTVPQVRGVNASVFSGCFARMYAHGYEKFRISNRGVLYSSTFYPGLSGAGNSIQTTNYIVGTSTGIGINTTTPGYKFDVNGTARIQDTLKVDGAIHTGGCLNFTGFRNWDTDEVNSTGEGAGIVNDNGNYKCLMILGNRASDGTNRKVKVWDNLEVSNSITSGGTITGSKVYNAVYNDYAEYFEKDEERIEPGDIVIKNENGEGYVKSRHAFDDLVVGVVSDEFAQCIGGEGEGSEYKGYVPVGLAGRLRVKIKGKCKIGDLIVASYIPGVGMAIDKKQYIPGTVVGKALENKDTEEIERVRMLIMNI